MRPLQHFDDFAIGAAAGFDAGDAHQNAVAVHGFTDALRRQKHVALNAFERLVGNQEAVAVAMHVEAANGEFARTGGDHVVPAAQFDQFAAVGETRQRSFQTLAAVALCAKFTHQLLEVGAGVG